MWKEIFVTYLLLGGMYSGASLILELPLEVPAPLAFVLVILTLFVLPRHIEDMKERRRWLSWNRELQEMIKKERIKRENEAWGSRMESYLKAVRSR